MAKVLERTYYISMFKSEERYLPCSQGYCLPLNHHLVEKYGYDTRSTQCRFGGCRNWFICAECEGNCLLLYYVGDGFKCRKCSKILYDKQTMSHSSRTLEKQWVDSMVLKWKWEQINRPYYKGSLTRRASKLLIKLKRMGDYLRREYL